MQCTEDPRLADAGVTGDGDHLAGAFSGQAPAVQQQSELLLTTHQRRERLGRMERFEAAFHVTCANDTPGVDRLAKALELPQAEIHAIKPVAHQSPRRGRYDHRTRLALRLEPGCKVRRGAGDHQSIAGRVARWRAYHHHAGGDSHAHLHANPGDHAQLLHLPHGLERSVDRAFSTVLLGVLRAEAEQLRVPLLTVEVAIGQALVALHDFLDPLLGADQDVARVLRVEGIGECSGLDDVAYEDGRLAQLGLCRRRRSCRRRLGRLVQPVPARRAEARQIADRPLAPGAEPLRRRSALRAELVLRPDRRAALTALHGHRRHVASRVSLHYRAIACAPPPAAARARSRCAARTAVPDTHLPRIANLPRRRHHERNRSHPRGLFAGRERPTPIARPVRSPTTGTVTRTVPAPHPMNAWVCAIPSRPTP